MRHLDPFLVRGDGRDARGHRDAQAATVDVADIFVAWKTELIGQSQRSTFQTLKVRAVGTDEEPKIGALSRPVRFAARPAMRVLFRVRVQGLEHVPADGAAIISANHRSFFDSPLVMAMAPRRVIFLGKAEYMDSTTTKYLFPAVGMVPIKRDVKKASMAALNTAAELLEAGELVGIYPEGTRSRDGLLHRGHSGVAHLAMITGAPIIPVGLVGTDRVQPIGNVVPRPFQGPVTIRFGERIDPADYRFGGNRQRRQKMLDDVMASIAAMTGQTRSADFSSHDPPLIRGGSESVYRITAHGAVGLNWRHAAERAVSSACNNYDDARVGEVSQLRLRVLPNGDVTFETELNLSTRFRSHLLNEQHNNRKDTNRHDKENT